MPEFNDLTSMPPPGDSSAPVGKNIWYVSPYVGGPGIGRANRAYYLAQNWRAQSVRTTILCPTFHHLMYDAPQPSGARQVEDVSYHFIDARSYRGNGLGRLLNMADFTRGLLRDADRLVALYGVPDVIIGSSPHPYMFLATHRLARRFGAVSILEVRDLWPLSLVEIADVSPWHPLVIGTGLVEKYAYRNADHIVSLLPKTFEHMQPRGASADRWHHIPNGIELGETPEIDPAEPAYRQLCAWQAEGKFVVLYAGGLGPPNNMDILVQAAALLKASGDDDIRFLIVGGGESEAELVRMAEELKVDDRVIFHSLVPKRHAIGLMREADAGHMSLRPMPIYRYGISLNKLYDYMLAELPIVAAMEAGNSPVADAGCGIVLKPGSPDLLAQAYRDMARLDPAERQEMGARGRAYALEHHDYRLLSRKFSTLFDGKPVEPV